MTHYSKLQIAWWWYAGTKMELAKGRTSISYVTSMIPL